MLSIIDQYQGQVYPIQTVSLILLQTYSLENKEDLVNLIESKNKGQQLDDEQENLYYFYQLILEYFSKEQNQQEFTLDQIKKLIAESTVVDYINRILDEEEKKLEEASNPQQSQEVPQETENQTGEETEEIQEIEQIQNQDNEYDIQDEQMEYDFEQEDQKDIDENLLDLDKTREELQLENILLIIIQKFCQRESQKVFDRLANQFLSRFFKELDSNIQLSKMQKLSKRDRFSFYTRNFLINPFLILSKQFHSQQSPSVIFSYFNQPKSNEMYPYQELIQLWSQVGCPLKYSKRFLLFKVPCILIKIGSQKYQPSLPNIINLLNGKSGSQNLVIDLLNINSYIKSNWSMI